MDDFSDTMIDLVEPAQDDTSNPEEPQQKPDREFLLSAVDGLLFVSSGPVPFERFAELLQLNIEETRELILEKKRICDEDTRTGLQIVINEQGVQFATKASICSYIQRLEGKKLVNLSLPALEALSVIALKQPVTKAEIEAIRGVNSDGVVSTLLEKKLVYISGEKKVIGRPRLYSTTQDFLYYFGLKSLTELPVPSIDIPADFEPESLQQAQDNLDQIDSSQGLTASVVHDRQDEEIPAFSPRGRSFRGR